ncbi:hypothetical protein ISF_00905 [Cordyceps fumosorosea ARSEF 2679]|uniref:Uncharacterized protein n=1 Tax=Cordyceps fumosorosea (strain ARSEF 2679) TaxID=1081104 RepID=A0A162LQ47_CORFA|nr:hypothetical protein ISF_00905 [Cordyceps fumosorosea ARSEF 2679]OAA74004.1 hypothetical protein ISF_00905 [Cordyceps fumosorosea ARSEF 2679]
MRPTGTPYYDYTEDFKDPDSEGAREPDMPLSPVPRRTGSVTKPTILQQDMQLKMHGAIDNHSIPRPSNGGYRCGYSQTNSSIDESFDSYLQDDQTISPPRRMSLIFLGDYLPQNDNTA